MLFSKMRVGFGYEDATIEAYFNKSVGDCLEIPGEDSGYPITAIGESAFSCVDAKAIIMPDTIESIGKFAFANCTFKNLVLSKRLEYVHATAFEGCFGMENVEIPDGPPVRVDFGDYVDVFSRDDIRGLLKTISGSFSN